MKNDNHALQHGIQGHFETRFSPKLAVYKHESDGMLEHQVTGDFEVEFIQASEKED